MPYYYSEAATADGKIRKRILKAFDEKDADRQLRQLGLRPMLIESTSAVRKKKEEKAFATRRILRRTLISVAAVSLVGGIAGYLMLLDLKAEESALPAAMVSYAPDINYGDTPEQHKFAKYTTNLLERNFPGYFSNVTIRKRGLMLVYECEEIERLDSDVEESILAMVTRGFQRRYKTKACRVYFIRNEKPVAEGRYRDGKVTTAVY